MQTVASGEDGGDDHEGRAPADLLAEVGAERHAHDVRDGEPGEHERDALRALAGPEHIRGDEGADAEVRAVRQSGEEAGGGDELEGRQQEGQCVEDGQREREADHDAVTRILRDGAGDRRRADDHAEGVERDEPARLGDGILLARRPQRRQHADGDVRQQAHDDELGHADAEAADGEGEERPLRRTPRRSRGGHPVMLAGDAASCRIDSIGVVRHNRLEAAVARAVERLLEALDLPVDLAR